MKPRAHREILNVLRETLSLGQQTAVFSRSRVSVPGEVESTAEREPNPGAIVSIGSEIAAESAGLRSPQYTAQGTYGDLAIPQTFGAVRALSEITNTNVLADEEFEPIPVLGQGEIDPIESLPIEPLGTQEDVELVTLSEATEFVEPAPVDILPTLAGSIGLGEESVDTDLPIMGSGTSTEEIPSLGSTEEALSPLGMTAFDPVHSSPVFASESFVDLSVAKSASEDTSVRFGGLSLRGDQAYASVENAFQGRADYVAVA